MKLDRRFTIAIAALLLAGFVSGCSTYKQVVGDIMGDKGKDDAAAIAEANKRWLGLIVRKDADAIGALYTENGAFLVPGGPTAVGPIAISGAWDGLLKLPNVTLNFRTVQLDIAPSGDLASDRGTYDLAFDSDKGRVTDHGKYVVVWKKVDGEWKVLADIFNSDYAK